jgi:hypothetical protein
MTRRFRPAKPLALAALAALLLAAPGCRAPHRAPNRIDFAPERESSITIKNEGLQNRCGIRGARALYEDEILMGVIDVESGVDRKKLYEYRFSWKDSDGIALEARPWDELHIDALESKQVHGRASEPGAVSGYFEVRYILR